MSAIEVKVFSTIRPLMALLLTIANWMATAPPRERPKMNILSLSMSSWFYAYSRVASASNFNPSSDGTPSLSPYPLYAKIKTFALHLFTIISMLANLYPIFPAFSWKNIIVRWFLGWLLAFINHACNLVLSFAMI